MSGTDAAAAASQAKIASLAKKLALVQKVLSFLTWGHVVVGAVFLLALLWCQAEMGKFALMSVAPFYLALGYAANNMKKNLGQLTTVLPIMAISQLGFALVLIIGLLLQVVPLQYIAWTVVALIFGALPAAVNSQAKKIFKT